MTKMISRPRTFVKDLNSKTSVMKTKTTYPEKARKAKTILVAVLFLIQASLIANDSSDVNQNYNETKNANYEYTGIPATLNTEKAYCNINEVAFETEYEIEDWMSNIQNDSFNSQLDEKEIELEEWMYNPQHSFWLDLNDAEESELAIESWMTNLNDWINTCGELLLTSK